MLNYDRISQQWVNEPDPEEDAFSAVFLAIERHAAWVRSRFLSEVSAYEAASWAFKVAEAKAGGGPMLQGEADARGISLQAMMERVLAKAASLAALEGHIAGVSGRHRDAIRLLQTPEEILAYDWRDGWPE